MASMKALEMNSEDVRSLYYTSLIHPYESDMYLTWYPERTQITQRN